MVGNPGVFAGADVLEDDPLTCLMLAPEHVVVRILLVAPHSTTRGIPFLHLRGRRYEPAPSQARVETT